MGRAGRTAPPVLRTHAPSGERIDEVEFHPSWHSLMGLAVGGGPHRRAVDRPPASGAHVRRAAGFVVWSRVEAGHVCPVSMTYAAGSALAADPPLRDRWLPRLASRTYDFGLRPLADKAARSPAWG